MVPARGLLTLTLAVALAAACNTAASKQEAIRKGDEAVAKEQYAEAISAYQTALRIDSNDGELRFKLAAAHRRAQQWGEAAEHAVRAADLLPGNREAQVEATSALLNLGRFVDATERAQRLLEQTPDDPRILVLFANAKARFYGSGGIISDFDEALTAGRGVEDVRANLRPNPRVLDDRAAEQAFRRALQLDPSLYDPRLALASLLWATGRLDDGADILKAITDSTPGNAFVGRILGLFFASRENDRDAERYLTAAAATGDRLSRLALADFLIARQRTTGVVEVLQSMVTGGDDSPEVTLRLADLELLRDNADAALRLADRTLAQQPQHARALRIKADVLVGRNGGAPALAAARAAAAAAPSSYQAREVLGRALKAAGDTEGAFAEFAAAFRLHPSSSFTPKELAQLALALNREKVALEFARQAVRRSPGDSEAALTLVQALIRARDFSAADSSLRPLLAKNPSSSALLVEQGTIEEGRGNHAAARASYEKALRADPNSISALSALVSQDLATGSFPIATQRVERAAAAHPKDPAYLLLLARVAVAAKDVPRSESTLKQVLGLDPENVGAAELLADVLAGSGRGDEAIRVLDASIARRPTLTARMARARVLESIGRANDAIVQYEQVVAKDSDAVLASARLASLYVAQRRNLDRALALASDAKQRLPDNPQVNDVLGWVYVHKSFELMGIPHLEKAVNLAPNNPTYRYHLGVAYQRLSRRQAARDQFAKALALSQVFPEVKETRAALESLK